MAEPEIELLHDKIDALREREVLSLALAMQELTRLLLESQRVRSQTANDGP